MKKSFLKITYDDTGHIGLVLIPLKTFAQKNVTELRGRGNKRYGRKD